MVKKSENLWFAEWFDTKYYHTLYKHRDESEAELFMRNIISHLQLDKESHICDLACGKGRHAQFLSTLGYRVTGLDLSENSIRTASKNANDRLSFDVHDMRDVYQQKTFDAVFNLFTSFGYFDSQSDNLKVLTSISEMLNEDGVLVIDFMNAEKVINKLVAEEVKSIEGIEFHINRTCDGAHIYKNIQFNDNGEHFDFTERVQALTRTHFEQLLDVAQFELLNVFGNYKLESFDEQNSDRLILIARKR
jgi:2-polyprenyl-3-methyl-5-hydroxy-6-metoxy-1,4-benzoquinol methylase